MLVHQRVPHMEVRGPAEVRAARAERQELSDCEGLRWCKVRSVDDLQWYCTDGFWIHAFLMFFVSFNIVLMVVVL